MEARPGRPQPDGPQIAAPRTHLVDKLADDEHGDGIDDGEAARDKTVVRVVPSEFRRNKIFPRQRQDLTVHVVDGRSQEQHGTYDPTVTGHSCKCLIRFIHVFRLFFKFIFPYTFANIELLSAKKYKI